MTPAWRFMDHYAGALRKLAETERGEWNAGEHHRPQDRQFGRCPPKEMLEHLNVRAGDTLAVVQEPRELLLRRLEDDPEEFERKMKLARERMRKYETAYRALSK